MSTFFIIDFPNEYGIYFGDPIGNQDVPYFENMKVTPKMIIEVLGRLFYSINIKRKLEKLIQDKRPDTAYILHHYNKLSPSVIDACKKYNIPVYIRLSDYFLLCPQAHMLNGNNQLCTDCVSHTYLSSIS